MLTKQERNAIAERLKNTYYIDNETLFKALTDKELLSCTSFEQSTCMIASTIVDLCDTSNMIELPVDRDGEVIRIGDTVYDCECTKYEVAGHSSSSNVLLSAGRELICFKKPANDLTHKEPVTVKLLAQRIKRVLGDEASSISVVPHIELRRIAKQLESLGDSNE